MIYEINNKYYVKVGSFYNEIEIKLDSNGDVTLSPLKNRIEVKDEKINIIDFKASKELFKKKLKKNKKEDIVSEESNDYTNYRNYNRYKK